MHQYNRTPDITVFNNQGLVVRDIAYYRHPDALNHTDERITRHSYTAGGFPLSSLSPRQHDLIIANPLISPDRRSICSLNGTIVRSDNTDDGTTVTLTDVAGRPLMPLVQPVSNAPGNMKKTHCQDNP